MSPPTSVSSSSNYKFLCKGGFICVFFPSENEPFLPKGRTRYFQDASFGKVKTKAFVKKKSYF